MSRMPGQKFIVRVPMTATLINEESREAAFARSVVIETQLQRD